MRPDPHARAIAGVIRDLLQTRDATTYFVQKISGDMMMSYNQPGEHPLVGCSARGFRTGRRPPRRRFPSPTRQPACSSPSAENAELRALIGQRNDRLHYLAAPVKDGKGLSAMLIRPDGFVACAADAEINPPEWSAAMDRWFGPPIACPARPDTVR